MKKTILNKKAISPLITTILLIVVVVAIIGIIISWGKTFTQDNLQNNLTITKYNTSDATHFIFAPKYQGNTLTFTYSPSPNLKNKLIIVNKVSVLGYDDVIELSEPITLSEGYVGISNLNLSSINIQETNINLVLHTTTNEFINLKNIRYNVITDLYTVRFLDHDSSILKTQEVAAGTEATAPEEPTRTGYTFTGWDVSFENITGDLDVTAEYTINSYTLTVLRTGGAGGLVISDIEGISCGAGCSANYEYGTEVVLTASPTLPGTGLNEIIGDCVFGSYTCRITMTEAKTVTFDFMNTSVMPP